MIKLGTTQKAEVDLSEEEYDEWLRLYRCASLDPITQDSKVLEPLDS